MGLARGRSEPHKGRFCSSLACPQQQQAMEKWFWLPLPFRGVWDGGCQSQRAVAGGDERGAPGFEAQAAAELGGQGNLQRFGDGIKTLQEKGRRWLSQQNHPLENEILSILAQSRCLGQLRSSLIRVVSVSERSPSARAALMLIPAARRACGGVKSHGLGCASTSPSPVSPSSRKKHSQDFWMC